MGVRGAAWRGLGWPAEAAQEMVELHVQRVEAAERRGKANPWRLNSPEQQTEAAAADCLGKEKRGAYRWGKGTQRCQGCLSAPQTVVWGSRRAGRPAVRGGGGALCFPVTEVEEDTVGGSF